MDRLLMAAALVNDPTTFLNRPLLLFENWFVRVIESSVPGCGK